MCYLVIISPLLRFQSTLLRNRSFFVFHFTGPFWVCATLTFCIGIAGNVADFFHRSGLDFVWKYDFHKGEADLCKSKKTIVASFLLFEEAMFCHKAMIVVLQPLRFFFGYNPRQWGIPITASGYHSTVTLSVYNSTVCRLLDVDDRERGTLFETCSRSDAKPFFFYKLDSQQKQCIGNPVAMAHMLPTWYDNNAIL